MSQNPLKVIISGAAGRMGRYVAECITADCAVTVAAGVDKSKFDSDFPLYTSISDVKENADVIIDFSNTSALDGLLKYAVQKNVALVLATTGYTEEQIAEIKPAAEKIPVFFSFNMSLGINLVCSLVKQAAAVLGKSFTVEIIEKHHNQKLDAPSGTAIMLADAVNGVFNGDMVYEYDRHSKRVKRPENEIGIHSVRGGTIVGEHDIIFAGNNETVTISHSAASRSIFATGAVNAAKFIVNKEPKLYDMNDLIKDM